MLIITEDSICVEFPKLNIVVTFNIHQIFVIFIYPFRNLRRQIQVELGIITDRFIFIWWAVWLVL